MKRSSQPLRRTAGPTRRTPLRAASPRGVPWRLRQRVIERDGGCAARWAIPHDCAGRIDPHHVWRKGQGGPDEVWNLVAVCRVAHRWIHDNVAESMTLGFLSRAADGEFGARQAADRRHNIL